MRKPQKEGLFDITQLRKIVDYFAKFHDEMMQQKARQLDIGDKAKEDRDLQRRSLAQIPMTSLEKLLELILNKIRINFGNAQDAF
jgi:hypothetical protein